MLTLQMPFNLFPFHSILHVSSPLKNTSELSINSIAQATFNIALQLKKEPPEYSSDSSNMGQR
jgi:hypothetical protein